MNDDLKTLIVAKLDVYDFLDIIGFELDDLVEELEEYVEEYREELLRACR